ncbi:MAG: hypothetical protein NTY19_52070 [Planctomycetota bacterium]|nr:hypothetical protein [Planctomycetota bacterium]
MVGVTFSLDLKAGPSILEGRFIDETSGQWRSPFYVYVKRIGIPKVGAAAPAARPATTTGN